MAQTIKVGNKKLLVELLAFSYTQGCSSSYKESRQKLGDFGPCNLKSGDPEVILFILLMKLTTTTFNSDEPIPKRNLCLVTQIQIRKSDAFKPKTKTHF